MYPHERSLVEKYGDRGFSIVGINSDSTAEIGRKATEKNQLTWRNFYDGGTDGPISTKWNVNGWPTLYLIDSNGVIRFRDLRGDPLEQAIDKLVEEITAPREVG
ncbi:MAG TPA: TlpA family protein disulfide reductase [Planctomycetes bacterium]|nr:TlpA family protein disulfide reductase [Planctomycetota bacterium]